MEILERTVLDLIGAFSLLKLIRFAITVCQVIYFSGAAGADAAEVALDQGLNSHKWIVGSAGGQLTAFPWNMRHTVLQKLE